MKRVSVFDWHSRIGDEKTEWALEYYQITNDEAEIVAEECILPPIPTYEEFTLPNIE